MGTYCVCRWRPGLPSRRFRSRAMISFGGDLTAFNFANYFALNLDNALIGKFWGAQQLGLYAKAYQLLLLPLEQINGPLGTVAIPALSRLADSPDRYRIAYLKILEKLTMLTMPAVVFMIATSDWFVLLLLGPQWQQTGRIFMLLGMAGFIQPVTRTCWWLLISQGRSRDMLRACSVYNWDLKQRIMSRVGHLSNEDLSDWLTNDFDGRARYIVLAHLSQRANEPHLARITAEVALKMRPPLFQTETRISISNHKQPTEWIGF